MGINYVKGDATFPLGSDRQIVCHICNNVGGWGRGFVLALSRRWPEPEVEYRRWFRGGSMNGFVLGGVGFVQVTQDIVIANMIAQDGIRTEAKMQPIRYDALSACLALVSIRARDSYSSVHMPRIGCGLAGGSWPRIEPLIVQNLTDQGIPVTVYDL